MAASAMLGIRPLIALSPDFHACFVSIMMKPMRLETDFGFISSAELASVIGHAP
jgi:hypothetical protein